MFSKNFEKIIKKIKNKNRQCRICSDEICEQNDHWIHPCGCRGSMLWVHINCLKKWIETSGLMLCSTCGIFYKIKKIQIKEVSSRLSQFLHHPVTITLISTSILLFIIISNYYNSCILNRLTRNRTGFFYFYDIFKTMVCILFLQYIAIFTLLKRIFPQKINKLHFHWMDVFNQESMYAAAIFYIPRKLFQLIQCSLEKEEKITEDFIILDY